MKDFHYWHGGTVTDCVKDSGKGRACSRPVVARYRMGEPVSWLSDLGVAR